MAGRLSYKDGLFEHSINPVRIRWTLPLTEIHDTAVYIKETYKKQEG
jgi:hypothetical protein